MKIVQLAPAYIPHIGGVETHVAEVNKELLKQGHSITVVTVQHEPSLSLQEVIDGVKVIRLPYEYINKKLPTWKWVWQNQSVFDDAEVIQVHDIFWWLYPILPFIEDKVFTTFHGWEGIYPVKTSTKLQRLMANFFSRGSVHVGDWIREFYWDQPSEVTYGGVIFQKPTKKTSPKKNMFVFFGRLSPDNDIEKYIALAKVLKKQLTDFSITWIGDGEFAAQCRKVGKVTGFVTNPEKYWSEATFVLASSYLSILAAQAQGKIVCAFYSHLLKERYVETFPGREAMLVADSVETMVKQILLLTKDSRRLKKMQETARAIAIDQSWFKVTKMYERLWRKQ